MCSNHIVSIVMGVLIACTLTLFIIGINLSNPFILVISSILCIIIVIWYLVDSFPYVKKEVNWWQ